MPYLRLRDYNVQIQQDNLNQIISSDSSVRTMCENAALEEMKSYLLQKYDCDREFTNTPTFSASSMYYGESRVYLDAAAWNNATTYAVNDLVVASGLVYRSIQAGLNHAVTDTAFWKLLGDQYAIYYVPTPADYFDVTVEYLVGEFVFYNNRIYKAAKATVGVFPDTTTTGPQTWGTGVAFTITGVDVNAVAADYTAWNILIAYTTGQKISYSGAIYQAMQSTTGTTPGTDSTYWALVSWTAGDNRSQQAVLYLIDMTLYHLHSRIAPRNIPELRMDRYESAVMWLKAAAKGGVNAQIPTLQPRQGQWIRSGGSAKNINSY